MAFTVRAYEHRDADGILRLYRLAGSWFEDVEVTRDFIVASSERPDFRFQVAEDGKSMVGFIGALYFKAVGRAELGPIAVDESIRCIGVGSALVASMMRFLSVEGIRRVTVKVKSENKAAIGFFIGKGFSHDAYLRRYTLKGEDVVELTASL
ncbi:MAG: GNAT family N-acetyltransferase [Candidatus Altiarchaeota archaeon]